jgi:hypothetical protein
MYLYAVCWYVSVDGSNKRECAPVGIADSTFAKSHVVCVVTEIVTFQFFPAVWYACLEFVASLCLRFPFLRDTTSEERNPYLNQFVKDSRRLSIPLGKHATAFQAEVYAILFCAHETESQDRPAKYVSISSDSQAALKALQAAKTTSPLVRHCQQALNDISTRHAGPCWSAKKWNGWQARKERFWSAVYWAWAFLGGL